MKEMAQKLDNIVLELQEVKQENNKLKEKINTRGDRIEKLERTVRQKYYNKRSQDETATKGKIEVVMQKIGINIDMVTEVDEIRRLGKYTEKRTRPTVIKLLKESKKIQIMKMANTLKVPKY